MKKLFRLILMLVTLINVTSSLAQTNFSFTNKPFSDPEMNNWGRGAVYWNGTAWDNSQAPTIPEGTSRGKNSFWRFAWCDLEDNTGNYVFYGTYPRLDHYVRQTIDRGEMLHFGGVMPICSACGGSPTATFFNGATMYYPKYIHDSMQKTSQPAWNTGTGVWMPNWNNPYYLERYEKLLLAVADYFNTGSYVAQSGPWAGKRIYYKDLLDGVGINGYGDFGEWHNWPYDGNIPSNAMATSASLKRIINANVNAFPNTQLITLMGSFYNGGSSKVPLDVTYHVLTQKNNFGLIGWRRDNIGDPGYGGWLENNPNSFNGMRFDTAIVNRWKYATVTGEPLNGNGSCCPYYHDIRRQTNLYHYSAYGNGNYGSRTAEVWDTIRNVFKISGYRYNLNGGSMTTNLVQGQQFNIRLNWRNVGVAPIYQKRWKVKYELKNSSDQVVQAWTSRLQLYLFLPSSVDSVISENFTLNSNVATGNTYKLTIKLEDTIGVLEPIFLAINSPTRNADGSYTLRSNITVQAGGGGNIPPTANAGPDQTITLPTSSVTLVGSGTDTDGSITSYSWTKVSGGAATITSPSLATTTVTGLVQGSYIFRLTVGDNNGLTGSDDVNVTVNQTGNLVNLSFTNKPFSDPEMPNYHRGAHYWNGTQWNNSSAPQVPPGTTTSGAKTWYARLEWVDMETTMGTYTLTEASLGSNWWRSLEAGLKWCANNGALWGFGGVMTAYDGEHGRLYDGAWSQYPEYLHQMMQAEPLTPDWKYTSTNNWIPNWNSPSYLSRWRALNDTIMKFVKAWKFTPTSGPWAGKLVEGKNIIDFVDIRGYGNFGEWHTWPWSTSTPTNARATDSTFKKIIDVAIDIYGDYPIHIPVGAFDDNGWAQGTAFTTWYALTSKTRYGYIGWRRDNIGDPGLDNFLIGNTFTGPNGWKADTAILNRWKFAMITGEPLNGCCATCCPWYFHIRPEIGNYHYSSFGNGNYGNNSQQTWDTINAVFKLTGYRFNLNGGSMTNTLTQNNNFNVNLNWRNVGASPLYQKRWKVVYQLKTSNDVEVRRWVSNFKPYLFLPSNSDSIVSETFNVGPVPTGTTYKLTVMLEDTVGFLSPLFLALNSPTRNADGSYTLRSNITVQAGGGGNLPPVANAGSDQAIRLPVNSVTLNGSASYDVDGTITSYSWTKVSGGAATITSPSSVSTTVTGLVAGTYVFQLSVTDNNGLSSSDNVQIIVNPAFIGPTANAGPDQTITLPTNSVTLNGSGSTDPDGSITSYSWTKVSGGAATITSPSSVTTSVTGLVAGTYVFQLTVRDNNGLSSSDNVQIVVNNQTGRPPVAVAGTDQNLKRDYAIVNGGSSYDPDGTITAYNWSKISGPSCKIESPTAARTYITGLTNGVYLFQLRVTDNQGLFGLDTIKITVSGLRVPPTANAGPDQTITLPTNSVTLNGSGTDPDGTITKYAWTKVGGGVATITSPSSATTTVTGLAEGIYLFRLTVTDNNNLSGSDTVKVTVLPRPIVTGKAPILNGVSFNSSVSNTVTTSLTNVPTNSLLVLCITNEDAFGTVSVASNPTLTWTRQVNAQSAGSGNAAIFTAIFPDGGGVTVTSVMGSNSSSNALYAITNYSTSYTVGSAVQQALPSVSLTTTKDSSLVIGAISDWNAVDGANRTYTIPVTETNYVFAPSKYTAYYFRRYVSPASSLTYGLTSPTGQSSSTVLIEIKGADAAQPPVANAGADQRLTRDYAIVNGVNSFDPDGTIVSYEWTKISGGNCRIESPTTSRTYITGLTTGTYVFQLKVTDNQGLSGFDTITINVTI